MKSKQRQRLAALAVGLTIILVFLAGLGLLTTKVLAEELAGPDYIANWTELQRTAHEIATMAREAGLPEDSPIIAECQRIWWEENERNLSANPSVAYGDTSPYKGSQGDAETRSAEAYPVARVVWDYLHACGLSDAVSAGILGNAMRECGGDTMDLQPFAYGGGGRYYGLWQWSGTYYPQAAGLDVEGQLQLLMDTIEGTIRGFGGDYGYFCGLTSAYDAAVYFCDYYERGAGASLRGNNAVRALEYFTGD